MTLMLSEERVRPVDRLRLRGMIDAGCMRLGYTKRDGTPAYYKLARAMELSEGAVYQIVNKGNEPERDTLLRFARVFGDDPLLWLEVGGFEVEDIMATATPLERDLARLIARYAPTDADKEAVREAARAAAGAVRRLRLVDEE